MNLHSSRKKRYSALSRLQRFADMVLADGMKNIGKRNRSTSMPLITDWVGLEPPIYGSISETPRSRATINPLQR